MAILDPLGLMSHQEGMMEVDILLMKEGNDLSCLVALQALDHYQEDSDRIQALEDHNLKINKDKLFTVYH